MFCSGMGSEYPIMDWIWDIPRSYVWQALTCTRKVDLDEFEDIGESW